MEAYLPRKALTVVAKPPSEEKVVRYVVETSGKTMKSAVVQETTASRIEQVAKPVPGPGSPGDCENCSSAVVKTGVEKPALAPSLVSTCETDRGGSFGTAVAFVSSPREASKRAKEEERLVFLLHISGNFEDAAFT
jgi:hypothetical protein